MSTSTPPDTDRKDLPGRCAKTNGSACETGPPKEYPRQGWYTLFVKPTWLGQFLGQTILRVCPEAKKDDPCEGCELRVLCKCAQDDFTASMRVERRVWAVIAACAAGVLIWAVI